MFGLFRLKNSNTKSVGDVTPRRYFASTKPPKFVIIGGVAAGATAAAKARRENEQAEITLFEQGPYVSWANCGLPYFISGKIPNRNSLFLQTEQGFWNRYKVKVNVNHTVSKINRKEKTITVKNLQTQQEFNESYDKLLISPGAGGIVPPFPGVNSKNIFLVKSVPDADKIKQFIAEKKPKNAVVIGGGFIGLETAEGLHEMKLNVTVIDSLPQILPPFDPDMAKILEGHLTRHGMTVLTGETVQSFSTSQDLATHVKLASGKSIPCDMVILSVGVRPETMLAKDCGLDIGSLGGIVVNDKMQTSDPDIYAAGDAVECVQLITGKKTRFPLAGPANKQGRVVGANAVGGNMKFPGALGTSIVECLGVGCGMTGLSEKVLKKEGIPYQASIVHALHHAGYYPGATMLHIKLLNRTDNGKILGVQVIGENGVDKRVDVIATAIQANQTVEDLEHLDLSYSPQFGSAKDPIIMSGFVASNTYREEEKLITVAELEELRQKGVEFDLVDVRTPAEVKDGTIPDAKSIPVDSLRNQLDKLNKDKLTIVFCRVGMRGYLAYRILVQNGFTNVKNLTGGYMSYKNML